MDLSKFSWIREPKNYKAGQGRLEIVTEPGTDLWQRTYYHFRNDNAPCFQMETEERYFSFVVKTSFKEAKHRFDQCGVILYLDSENWIKGSIEHEDGLMSPKEGLEKAIRLVKECMITQSNTNMWWA